MQDDGRGWELVWILWTGLAALFVIFGVVALAGSHHPITFWLLTGLLLTNCSSLAWAVSLRRRADRRAGGGLHPHFHPPGGSGGGPETWEVFPTSGGGVRATRWPDGPPKESPS